MKRSRTAALALLAGLAPLSHAQLFTWTAAGDGTWDNPANWSVGGIFPNDPMHDVLLASSGGYVVTLDESVVVNALTIPDAAGLLNLTSGDTLDVLGPLAVDGTIFINSNATVFNARLLVSQPITGSGTIRLLAPSEPLDGQLVASAPTSIGSGITIAGSGTISGAFANDGTIRADDPAAALQINDAITQSAGGTIRADDATLNLSTASIVGGRLETTGTGAIVSFSGESAIADIELDGTLGLRSGTTLALSGGLTLLNGALVDINSNDTVFNATLRLDANGTIIDGDGTVRLQQFSDELDAQLTTAAGVTGTIAAGVSVRGSGVINGSLSNDGSIVADDPAQRLIVRAAIANAAGQIGADNAVLGFRDGASLVGGVIGTVNGGAVAATNGTTTFDGVTNIGNLQVLGQNTTLALTTTLTGSGFTNNGTLTINANATVFNATLRVDSSMTLAGTGDIALISVGDPFDAQLLSAPGVVTTIGPGQTVGGSGTIAGDFVVDGVITATDPIETLFLQDGSIVVNAGGELRGDGGVLTIRRASVAGGTFGTSGGGLVTFTGGPLDDNTLDNALNTGDLGINGNNVTVVTSAGFTNNGTFIINANDTVFNARLRIDNEATIDGNGTILLRAPSDLGDAEIVSTSFDAVLGAGQTLAGQGRLTGDFTILGTISPGEGGVGLLAGANYVTMGAGSTIEMEIGGPASSEFDRLSFDIIDLAGTLDLSVINNYNASIGDSFTIIDAPGIVLGAFDSVNFPPAPASGVWKLDARANEVRVVVTCLADLSSGSLPGSPDFVLTGADFFEFLALFQAGDLTVDFSSPAQPGVPDGVLSGADFFFFLNLFSAGCN